MTIPLDPNIYVHHILAIFPKKRDVRPMKDDECNDRGREGKVQFFLRMASGPMSGVYVKVEPGFCVLQGSSWVSKQGKAAFS